MILTTSGFFGDYSEELSNPEYGTPYMQPYAFNNKYSSPSFFPALNMGGILEDKGEFDMTSKMKFMGTTFMPGSEIGRDYFLASALRSTFYVWKGSLVHANLRRQPEVNWLSCLSSWMYEANLRYQLRGCYRTRKSVTLEIESCLCKCMKDHRSSCALILISVTNICLS
jgi:hypothetical protein